MTLPQNFSRRLADKETQAESKRNVARAAIKQIVTDKTWSEEVYTAALSLATAEGYLEVIQRAARLAYIHESNGTDLKTELSEYLMTVLIAGADDTWSGRGNDRKRAHFDGKRDAARVVFELITYGA